MTFTKYGKALAQAEALPDIEGEGAAAHMAACKYDAGIMVHLTGTDAYGQRFKRHANSVYGAYATAKAAWGIQRAWHFRPDGTRKLLFTI